MPQITISSKITSELFRQHEKGGEMVLNLMAYTLFFPGARDLLLVPQCQHFLSLVRIYSSKLAPGHPIPRFTFAQ